LLHGDHVLVSATPRFEGEAAAISEQWRASVEALLELADDLDDVGG